jgi:hypothetical protein
LEKLPLQSRLTLFPSKFLPANISFSKIPKKILAGKNLLCEFYFEEEFLENLVYIYDHISVTVLPRKQLENSNTQ